MRYEHLIGRGFKRWSEGVYTPGQLEALRDYESFFILLSGAYRSGKSELLARLGIRHAFHWPLSKVGVFRAKLASLKKSTLPTILELVHPSWIYSWSNTDLILTLKNFSTISFIGADFSDRLGSIELTLALIDEASELSPESLGMIQGRLSGSLELPQNFEELAPNIQEYLLKTQNLRQTILACNPKSTSHYLYKDFIESPKPGHTLYNSNSISNLNLPESYLVQNLSAYVRPGISQDRIREEVQKIRQRLAPENGLHLQEYLTPFGQRNLLGLWVALEGAIYDLDESYHLVEEAPEDWVSENLYYGSVDFGFHNPRIAIFEEFHKFEDNKKVPCYLAIDYWSEGNKTGDDLIEQLKIYRDQYNWRYVYLPHDQPGIVKIAKKTFGATSIKRAKTEVRAGINTTSRFFNELRLLLLKRHGYEVAWKELTGYSWKRDRDGNWLDEPVKKDDHFPDDFRYFIHSRHHKDRVELEPEEPGIGEQLVWTTGGL